MRQRFTNMLKEAMRGGDKRRVATVRLIQAALKDKDIEARGAGRLVSDDEILSLLQKMVKQRQESLEIYEKAGRHDLATQESEEISIIREFLPKQMDETEIRDAITAAIAETGASSSKEMSKVIGALKAKFAGRIDFAKASALVKAVLSSTR